MVMNPPRALTVSEHVISEAITDEVMVRMHHHAATDGPFDFITHLLHPVTKPVVDTVQHVQRQANGVVEGVQRTVKQVDLTIRQNRRPRPGKVGDWGWH
jgi:hypothetical protein